MRDLRIPLLFLVLSYLAVCAGLVLTYDRLPARVATHFNAAGQPNDWMPRATHVWAMGGVAVGLSAFLLLLFYGMRFFPPSAIHIPRSDYWLMPERREETFRWIFRAGIWLAAAEAWFMLSVHLLLVSANTSTPVRLSSNIWIFGAVFLAIVVLWIVRFVWHFRRGL